MRGARPIKTLLLFASALAALATPAAAEHREPRKAIRPADQAYARNLLLKRAELPGAGWRAQTPDPGDDPDIDCPGYDFRDLTLTGEAGPVTFARGQVAVTSLAQVFPTLAQARTGFTRADTNRIVRCLAQATVRELNGDPELEGLSARVVSTRRLAQRGLGERATLIRLVFELKGPGGSIQLTVDVLAAQVGRAHVQVNSTYLTTGPVPVAQQRVLLKAMLGRARR